MKFSWQTPNFATSLAPWKILTTSLLYVLSTDTFLILCAVFYNIDLCSYCLSMVIGKDGPKDGQNVMVELDGGVNYVLFVVSNYHILLRGQVI